jgi:hypothetical protein
MKLEKDWKETILELATECQNIARSKMTIDELEDVAWEYHKRIGALLQSEWVKTGSNSLVTL